MAKVEQYRNKYENIDLTRTEDGVVTWRSYQGRSDHMGGAAHPRRRTGPAGYCA